MKDKSKIIDQANEILSGKVKMTSKEMAKLLKADEKNGSAKFAVGVGGERIYIQFSRPVSFVGFTRDQAQALGRTLIDRARGIVP